MGSLIMLILLSGFIYLFVKLILAIIRYLDRH